MIDPDVVEKSNLHRQTIHREADLGLSKAVSAARFIHDMNSDVAVTTYTEALSEHNSRAIVKDYDVILDACDNPRTRYLLGDACVLEDKPLISGSAIGLEVVPAKNLFLNAQD